MKLLAIIGPLQTVNGSIYWLLGTGQPPLGAPKYPETVM